MASSSGNYKPGVASVEGMVNKLIDLGVPEERILTTSVVPAEPELVKLLLKARLNMSKDEINAHVARLDLHTTPVALDAVGRSHRSFTPSQLKLVTVKMQRAARRATLLRAGR